MGTYQTSSNSDADFIQYMASFDNAQNGAVNIDSKTTESSDDEIEILAETTVTAENHRCEICNEGEFLIDKLLRFGGLINEKYKFVCEKCDGNFEHKSKLKEHSSKCKGPDCHQNVVNNSQNKSPAASENCDVSILKEHMPITCKVCLNVFKSQGGLTKHMDIKHSSLIHTCKICNAVFNNFRQFRQHCFEHQVKAKSFACTFCEKTYHSDTGLKRHIRKKHDSQVL